MQNRTLQSVQLHSETALYGVSVAGISNRCRSKPSRKKEISWQAVYYHWQKWNAAGCFEEIWQHSIQIIQSELDCEYLNLDGSHTLAKKGGEKPFKSRCKWFRVQKWIENRTQLI